HTATWSRNGTCRRRRHPCHFSDTIFEPAWIIGFSRRRCQRQRRPVLGRTAWFTSDPRECFLAKPVRAGSVSDGQRWTVAYASGSDRREQMEFCPLAFTS